jgi:hypothetical protein
VTSTPASRRRRGGPPATVPATRAAQQQVHQIIQQLINRGRAEGTIRNDVTPRDIVVRPPTGVDPLAVGRGEYVARRTACNRYLGATGQPVCLPHPPAGCLGRECYNSKVAAGIGGRDAIGHAARRASVWTPAGAGPN